MDHANPAAEANRKILPGIREGHSDAVATAARAALLDRLARQPRVTTTRWTRDELYEETATRRP